MVIERLKGVRCDWLIDGLGWLNDFLNDFFRDEENFVVLVLGGLCGWSIFL